MKFKIKPQIVEAVQWNCQLETLKFMFKCAAWTNEVTTNDVRLWFKTKEGEEVPVNYKDWIIKDELGNYSSMSPEIFEKTYEPVEEE